MFEDSKNYYDILEITPMASMQEIHEAYNKARNAYAGDSVAMYSLMSNDDCAKILEQIELAYSILGVIEKRSEYDKVKGFNQNKKYDQSAEKEKDFLKNFNGILISDF